MMLYTWRGLLIAFGLLLAHRPAEGQDLIEMYRTARVQAQAEKLMGRSGQAMPPRAPDRLPTRVDSLMHWLHTEEPVTAAELERPRLFEKAEWKAVRRLLRDSFTEEFGGTQWAYLGSHTRAQLDTTYTRVLRAQLEGLFGSPTQKLLDVLAEQDDEPQEYVQFEYWLVLNDSIPVIVMDAGGPYDRGVVLATDERYRYALADMRHALMQALIASGKEASYSDYYYDPALDEWYISGYAGGRYYTHLTSEPTHLIRRRQHAANRQN